MEHNLKSTLQKEDKSIVRKKKYLSFIERYPLYSLLLVYKEYQDEELYEECAIIRDALKEHKDKYQNRFPADINIPTHISEYETSAHQAMLEKYNIVVEEKVAKEKAALIKLKLPIE